MIGAIVGSALSVAGSVYGGITSARAMRRQRRMLEKMRRENKNWYEREHNADYTQRADAQRVLRRTEDAFRERNKSAAGTRAVIGGTEESVAATKEANAKGMADAASAVAANAESRKDSIEQRYQERDDQIVSQQMGVEVSRANNIASMVKGVTSAAGNLGTAIDGYRDSGNSPESTDTEGNNAGSGEIEDPDIDEQTGKNKEVGSIYG